MCRPNTTTGHFTIIHSLILNSNLVIRRLDATYNRWIEIWIRAGYQDYNPQPWLVATGLINWCVVRWTDARRHGNAVDVGCSSALRHCWRHWQRASSSQWRHQRRLVIVDVDRRLVVSQHCTSKQNLLVVTVIMADIVGQRSQSNTTLITRH